MKLTEKKLEKIRDLKDRTWATEKLLGHIAALEAELAALQEADWVRRKTHNEDAWQHAAITASKERDEARAERDRFRALLEVPLRKLVYVVRDYPGDKESRNWLERAREALEGK